jgi:hypothetical protein
MRAEKIRRLSSSMSQSTSMSTRRSYLGRTAKRLRSLDIRFEEAGENKEEFEKSKARITKS